MSKKGFVVANVLTTLVIYNSDKEWKRPNLDFQDKKREFIKDSATVRH